MLTSCRRGHSMMGDNVYVSPAGKRLCRECRRINVRAYKRVRYAQRKEDLAILWADPSATKVCRVCGEAKHLRKFPIDRTIRDGRRTTCYVCDRDRTRRWVYRMAPGEYDAMAEAQEGRCAACGDVVDLLHVDHDHRSGRIRGLLCGPCNRGLGCFDDDPERMERALAYLRQER